MAEISYPFDVASEGGGSELVSQTQWQSMAQMWASDRIDYRLMNTSYTQATLPFYASIVGSNIVVQPGAAWVGGFYYKLDAPWVYPAPTNSGSLPRRDSLVIRTNMAAGSANLAITTGQPSANLVDPKPQMAAGGIWELPLWVIDTGANNGAKSMGDRRRYHGPEPLWAPWNASAVSANMPLDSFVVDVDSNNNDSPREGFRGRDGFSFTRHLGKRLPTTPDVFTVTNKPAAANRNGWWRYIAPGTVSLSYVIRNTSTRAVEASAWSMGVQLPVNTSKQGFAHLQGIVENPERRDKKPNYIHVIAKNESGGNRNIYLYHANPSNLGEGLDGLNIIPGKSTLTLSGTYETDAFD